MCFVCSSFDRNATFSSWPVAVALSRVVYQVSLTAVSITQAKPRAPDRRPCVFVESLRRRLSAHLLVCPPTVDVTFGERGLTVLSCLILAMADPVKHRFEEAGSATVCEGDQGGGATAAGRRAPAAAWDPHRPVEVATAASCSITCWDLRTMK